MNFNLPSNVRAFLYVLSAVSMPVIVYLASQGVISDFWLGLATVINTAVLGLARINVTSDK